MVGAGYRELFPVVAICHPVYIIEGFLQDFGCLRQTRSEETWRNATVGCPLSPVARLNGTHTGIVRLQCDFDVELPSGQLGCHHFPESSIFLSNQSLPLCLLIKAF